MTMTVGGFFSGPNGELDWMASASWGRTGTRSRWRSSSRCARQPGAPATPATAIQVGACREAPVILAVDAAAMHAAGHAFYQAANGV